MLTIVTAVTDCVSTSAFASIVGIHIGIESYAVGIKIYTITTGTTKCKSIIWEKGGKKAVWLDVLKYSETLIDSDISHSDFFFFFSFHLFC